ncbi:MAG: glycosyltransferase family 9 protein [Candidatus Omnitrophota bacterium]
MQDKTKKIIVFSFSGIGNSLLAVPFLSRLNKSIPLTMDFLVLNKAMAEVFDGLSFVESVSIIPKNIFKAGLFLLKLRFEGYSYSITLFPSNKWQFNVIAFIIGAKKRISHSYNTPQIKSLSFLQNVRMEAVNGLCDIEQNMALLSGFGIESGKEKIEFDFFIPDESNYAAQKFINDNNLKGNFIVGIHPGAGGSWDERWQGLSKRWPAEFFSQLCDKIIEAKNAKVIIFGGSNENTLKNEVKSLSKHEIDIFIANAGSLKYTAALIKMCNLFISNDTSLMHISSAFCVPTLGIFGPTNHTRTSPYGKRSFFVRKGASCSPCLKYPFESVSSKIICHKSAECLRGLSVESVFEAIKSGGLI